mgnify:CR=1 FL=1
MDALEAEFSDGSGGWLEVVGVGRFNEARFASRNGVATW